MGRTLALRARRSRAFQSSCTRGFQPRSHRRLSVIRALQPTPGATVSPREGASQQTTRVGVRGFYLDTSRLRTEVNCAQQSLIRGGSGVRYPPESFWAPVTHSLWAATRVRSVAESRCTDMDPRPPRTSDKVAPPRLRDQGTTRPVDIRDRKIKDEIEALSSEALLAESALWWRIVWANPPRGWTKKVLLDQHHSLKVLRQDVVTGRNVPAARERLEGYCRKMRRQHNGASASEVRDRRKS